MNWHDLFHYDPETGLLTWKIRRSNRIKVGSVVGSLQTNHKGQAYQRHYLHVRMMEGTFFVHRIVFEMMTGQPIPTGMQIDHRDGDGTNNKWANLRLATRSQNMGNRARNRVRKHDLPKGVQWYGPTSSYLARLADRSIKYTKSLPEAVAAYEKAAREYYGEFAP